MTEHSIPFDIAFDFCKKYREKHKVRMFSQCWGCMRFSKGQSRENVLLQTTQLIKVVNLLINSMKKHLKHYSNNRQPIKDYFRSEGVFSKMLY